jgi:hypothetical protein
VLQEVADDESPAGPDDTADEATADGRRAGKPRSPRTDKIKRKPINYGRGEADDAEGDEGELAAGPERTRKPGAKPKWVPPPDVAKPGRKRWPLVVGIVAVILLLCGGGAGAYFWFVKGKGSATPKKEVAKSSSPPKPGAATTAKQPETSPRPEEPAVKPAAEAVKISAPRLAAELAAAPAEAGARYEGLTLEVSGLFEKLDPEMQQPGGGPPRLHPLFATDGAQVRGDLEGSPTELRRWQTIGRGLPITVRGVYSSHDGWLRACELLPLTPPADVKWKGKEFELTGYVDATLLSLDGQAFPTIQMEPETYGRVALHCLFHKTDDEEVKKARPGTPVTVRGTCGGRERVEDKYRVRMDNCQFIYTSAPTPPMTRVDAAQLLREYEEDLRHDLLPAPGAEERLETTVPLAQLAREFTADAKSSETKYRNKVMTVSGRVLRKVLPQGLILESENTDQTLQVSCWFGKHAFNSLEDGQRELTVRGLCTGMQDARTLRLDDCEPFDPAGKPDRRRLTADFLPHKPGRALTYDLAQSRSGSRGELTVVRQVFFEREGGFTETLVTHTGSLAGSLFDKGEQAKWVAQSRTHKVRLPGPVYQHRVSASLVEVGQQVLTRQRQVETVWEPALKLGVRVGESWKWYDANTEHIYTLDKFDERQGRPCAVIKEVVITNGEDHRPSEVRHVYVQDFGEVERQETLRLPSGEKKILAEKRLVEDIASVPAGEKPPRAGDGKEGPMPQPPH